MYLCTDAAAAGVVVEAAVAAAAAAAAEVVAWRRRLVPAIRSVSAYRTGPQGYNGYLLGPKWPSVATIHYG